MSAMTRQKTYLPNDSELDRMKALADWLDVRTESVQSERMALVSASGERIELPATLYDVLRNVGATLAAGDGVTVVPRGTRLTTQDAADFLGVSRPTLVKLLEAGAMPFETVGRHRRVLLGDLVAYQDRERARRRTVLARAAGNNQESGMLELTVMPQDG